MILQKHIVRTTALALTAAVILSAASPLAAMAIASVGPATDHTASVSEGEVAQALRHTSGVLEASDQVATTTDGDSALVAATAGATIDVPKDASDGVAIAANDGPSLVIGLPSASQAADGQQVAPGVIAYASSNGSANAVQAEEQGGVRMLTIIDNPNAPTKYEYKVTVPGGGRIQLTPEGGALVLDAQDQPISAVSAPWAKDARGKRIQTWFATDGTTLTQYVKHNVKGVVYPVTADPSFWSTAWKMTKCVGAVVWLVGSSVSGVKAIQALGGVTMAARLMIAAGGSKDWARAAMGTAGWILGIPQIRDNCF